MARAQETWELCQRQAADWVKASSRWLSSDSASDGGDGIAEETLRKMMDPTRFLFAGTDEINQAIQRLVEGPEFADIGTIERQVLKATREWMALREASAAYRGVTSAAWTRAFQTFSDGDREEPRPAAAGLPRRPRPLARHRQRRADPHPAHRRASSRRSANCSSAGVAYRLKERELVEVWCETHSIPTRTEVDDLHRTVHELRRQVRDAVRPPRQPAAQPARATRRRREAAPAENRSRPHRASVAAKTP